MVKYSDEELLGWLQKCNSEEGSCTRSIFNKYEGPCAATVTKRFDSWSNAKQLAGISTIKHSITDEELLEILEKEHSENPPIDNHTFRTRKDLPSAVTYTNHFGNIGQAIAESNIESNIYTKCHSCGGEYLEIGKHWARSDCNTPSLTDEQKEMAIGLLMSDAHINTPDADPKKSHCSLDVEMINEDFISWLSEQFGSLSRNTYEREIDLKNVRDRYRFQTRPHPFFDKLREWYSTGSKKFPEDLDITPTISKMWYVGDGGVKFGATSATPCIYTRNEAKRKEYILNLFKSKGFDPSWYVDDKNNNHEINSDNPCVTIAFTGQDGPDFLEWIGDAPPGFEYKWEIEDNKTYKELKSTALHSKYGSK